MTIRPVKKNHLPLTNLGAGRGLRVDVEVFGKMRASMFLVSVSNVHSSSSSGGHSAPVLDTIRSSFCISSSPSKICNSRHFKTRRCIHGQLMLTRVRVYTQPIGMKSITQPADNSATFSISRRTERMVRGIDRRDKYR